jgi:2-methylcitrate dehydratase
VTTLDILDGLPREPNTMAKNTAYPFAAQHGLVAALLASRGFTGPGRIIEGYKGFGQVALGNRYDSNVLTADAEQFRIIHVMRKPYVADQTTQGVIEAVLHMRGALVDEIEKITRVTVRASRRCITHTGDVDRLYSLNKETADHSLPYLVAAALLEGDVGPRQFRSELLHDRRIAQLVDKVELQPDPELDQFVSAGDVVVQIEGRSDVHKRVERHVGAAGNPFTWDDIAGKYRRCATPLIGEKDAAAIIEQVAALELLPNLDEMLSACRFAAGDLAEPRAS